MMSDVWIRAGLLSLVALGLASCGLAMSRESQEGQQPAAPPQAEARDLRKAAELLQAASLREIETLRGSATDKQKLRAARNLGLMAAKGGRTALDGLLQMLTDKEGGRRRLFAAIGLRESKSAEAVEPLIEVLSDQTAPVEVRKHAALALGLIDDKRAVAALLQAVDDSVSAEVRYYASVALYSGPFRTQVAQTPLLLKVLQDREQPQLRRARAAEFLSKMGDETAVAPLIALLAVEPRSPEITVDDPTNLEGAMYAGIMSPQRNVRAQIASALGFLADARAVKPLLQALIRAGDDTHLMEASQTALERIEQRGGATAFLAALKDADPAVRQRAVLFLAGRPGPEVEGLLQGVLNDDDPEVRKAVTAALSNLRERGLTPPGAPTKEGSDGTADVAN